MVVMLERFQNVAQMMVRKLYPEKNPYPLIRVVSDVSTEQEALQALRTSIKERAHTIAENVRNYGIQEFGPIWAQGYAVLSDGRIVFLQQSIGEAQVREALIINIQPTANDPGIHIRYDLRRDEINTYKEWKDGKLTIAYGIYDQPDYRTRFPKDLTLRDIVRPVKEILQLVEIASNKIVWTKPESTLVIPI